MDTPNTRLSTGALRYCFEGLQCPVFRSTAHFKPTLERSSPTHNVNYKEAIYPTTRVPTNDMKDRGYAW